MIDRAERRQSAPAAPVEAAEPPRQRRRGLDVVFHPEVEERPDQADVAEAVARIRK
jgi:hypothetical protein